jgi:hypothetical protein
MKYNEDCWCPCPIPECPFHAISSYLKLIPDPYDVDDPELKFMRVKITRGNNHNFDRGSSLFKIVACFLISRFKYCSFFFRGKLVYFCEKTIR